MGEHLRHRKQHSCVGNYADSVGTDDRSEGWREEVGGPQQAPCEECDLRGHTDLSLNSDQATSLCCKGLNNTLWEALSTSRGM